MDSRGFLQLRHRCGTCDEVFDSVEELCEHEQAHVGRTIVSSEPASANRYYYSYGADFLSDGIENSHQVNRGLPLKVPRSDQGGFRDHAM